MDTFQVNCHKPDNDDPDRRLQGLGGKGKTQWYRGIDMLIELIESGDKFWTTDEKGKSVWIEVHSRNGRKYLKTESDGIEPNNLLALPHCP
ncbi:MAG: hypothetical protein COB78_08395 [Hyphomicrobiales bacterium]|nr:MAG: hypothetical protein COB78_08395 [Hyphomicrobiales bacterium]